LRHTREVNAIERLAIFLYFVRHGTATRDLMERFQRSSTVISQSIHCISNLLVSEPFYSRYMPSFAPGTPPQIQNNPRLFPFFQHAVGAIDGS
ncbi:hypothetical protein C8R42DRAFT_565567, partial [Lentinula raphanica]